MALRTNVYFASDFHLGVPDYESSLVREKKIVRWLDSIKNDAKQIYLVGDIFDFWFEYTYVVPKGYTRLFGKLHELKDLGVDIHIFTGNHDMWMFGYFEKELNIPVHHQPLQIELDGKKIYIGHGDGIGPGDNGYKFLKKIFKSKVCQFAFSVLHPYISFGIAHFFSGSSRRTHEEKPFMGEDKEWQIVFAKQVLQKEHYDYFIFGHRHIVLQTALTPSSTFINLGDWMVHFTYLKFDGQQATLKYFEN